MIDSSMSPPELLHFLTFQNCTMSCVERMCASAPELVILPALAAIVMKCSRRRFATRTAEAIVTQAISAASLKRRRLNDQFCPRRVIITSVAPPVSACQRKNSLREPTWLLWRYRKIRTTARETSPVFR
ncbi:hypothetical protein KC325_g174 [Hortaea werneckii]|nr:hypothetical protein KC325_g174 [Hortaea werneckii]